jgi:isopentenyl-diphosphate delta-isomerase
MERWQLYDKHGRAIPGKGASKEEIFSKGLLHGAAHVWIWRLRDGMAEILLQRRASSKRTWPDAYDISAAGHIDLNEQPFDAALRETKEEISLDINPDDLKLITVHLANITAPSGDIEHEFQWLFLLKLPGDTRFDLEKSEVSSLVWKPLDKFRAEVETTPELFVPHGNIYYRTVTSAIEQSLAGTI